MNGYIVVDRLCDIEHEVILYGSVSQPVCCDTVMCSEIDLNVSYKI